MHTVFMPENMANMESLAELMEPLEVAIMKNKLAEWVGLRDYYESGSDEAAVLIGVLVSTLTLTVCWLGWKALEFCLVGWNHSRLSRTVPKVR